VNRFRTIAVTAVAGLVLVACGPSASSSSPSSAPSQAASEAQASSGAGVLPSFTAGAVADLEALIPDKVGDLTMQKQSMAGSDYLTSAQSDPATVKFIQDLGVSPSDISIALGFGYSADGSSSLAMFVFRAAGADTDRLVSVFKAAYDESRDEPLTWNTTTVAGKQVQVAVDGNSTIYLYAKGDVLFFISGDAASTEEVIGGLP
jgi:ABC-type glycerol-3-phosphate transport system substrate-binding protein